MRFLITLVTIVVFVAKSHTQDAELDEIFSQLSSALKQDANINNKIDAAKDEIKAEISKAPQKRTQFLGAAKALNGAVLKLQSDDPWVIAQGVLNAVAGIAEFIPGGIIFSSVLSVASSVIGILTGRKAKNTLDTVVRSALRDESDSELIGKANGAKEEILSAFSPLETHRNEKLTESTASFLTTQIKISTGVSILAELAHRIESRKRSTDGTQQLNCYRLSLLYAQIATMRDLVINDLIVQLRNSDLKSFAESYDRNLDTYKDTYKNTLEFYAKPEVSEAGVAHIFYPLGHSNDSIYIQDFLEKLAKVRVQKRNLDLPGVFSVYSKYWSDQFLVLTSETIFNSFYLGFVRGLNGNWRFRFEKRSDGYWAIKVADYWLKLEDQYLAVQDSKPTDAQLEGHFLIMQFKDPKVITLSSRKSPGYFWKGVSGDRYCVVSKGYNGEESLFTLSNEGPKKKRRKAIRKVKSRQVIERPTNVGSEVENFNQDGRR